MGSVREIRIARRTGFCYGVREAIDKAKEASAAGKSTHTLGQVVHNEGVIADLERLGIETFERLAAFMVGRSHELKIVNTVCPVTIRRQEDTVEAAQAVDLMVVVGGRSSANTKELTRLVGIAGKPAIQIEGASDLTDASVFDGRAVIGVTGGTSTPIEDLRDVAQRVLEIAGTPDTAARAAELAELPLPRAATPAGRTTSLPSFVHIADAASASPAAEHHP